MNRHILITGASRGLGFCLTKKYLTEGDTVYAGVRDFNSPDIRELQEHYPNNLIPVPLEVTDSSSVKMAADLVRGYTSQLDLIINNAAIHSSSSFEVLEKTNVDECLEVYDVNAVGPLRVVKEFLGMIRLGTKPKIINISSESGSISTCGREKEFDYCMSKAALNMSTKLLSNYLKKDHVTVLAVHPGWMRTDMGGANADLDPYETACRLVDLFDTHQEKDAPIFIDNRGDTYPW